MELKSIPAEYLPNAFEPMITFKDNSTLKARGSYNNIMDELWINMTEPLTFEQATAIFTDKSKTDSIRVDYSAIEYRIFEHYTHIITINENQPGLLSVRLRPE